MIILRGMMIFATQKTERLRYVLQFLFEEFCNSSYHWAQTENEFIQFTGPKINYSLQPLCREEIHISPSGFLTEDSLTAIIPEVKMTGDVTVLFPQKNITEYNWPFDVFSAVFFMLSRYEEYNNKTRDRWKRFPAKASLAYRHHFLHLPVVDVWLTQLLKALQAKHPQFFYERKTTVAFTYDVDVAYAYKGRKWSRIAGAAAKDILRINPYNLAQRTAVLAGYLEDPFDTYDYIKKETINPTVFFLLSEQKTKYDHNISPKNVLMKKLVNEVKQWSAIGVHPSFYSSDKTHKIGEEKKMLEAFSGNWITKSRQHYLRFTVPGTYRELLRHNITEDYSMAFAEMPGFRAGTCTPFYFFDVEKNTPTALKLYPSCIMESTFRDDMVMPVQKALPFFTQCFDEVNKVGGHFISIWHNDTLAANNKQQFRWLHQQILQYIRRHTNE